ncbi:MAG TPA: CpsB/CapC family capsule biosynthesis tyrosine phosphatase [Terriglobales bacterium]|nr:CpsB/CapC family capsule biosynthesis tyrosine phosphatase [Terriglobales bacterium]
MAMVDLHTHLIWGWDDGPDDFPQALTMCRIAEKDGIEAIGLTPHVFRMNRHEDDLGILFDRMGDFARDMEREPMEFHWGAEVYVHPEVLTAIEKYAFTIDDTNYVFLEFPSDMAPQGATNLVYSLMAKGYIPIISHPERNAGFVERPDLLYELVSMGCAAQVTAMSLTGEFGRETRAAAGLFMEHNLVHFIASDAHSSLLRPPVLSRAVEAAVKIVGEAKALAMVTDIPRAILGNQALPDWGEPENPLRRKTWTERLPMPKKSFLVKIK